MAFTFGFYNALNHDRRYNAIQVSSIFDGIIKDGIFMSIGGHMNVKATGNGFNIVVESGRAWFNHTWSLLDADYPMVVPPSDVLEDRIDVVVLEVNENVDVRQNFIKIISGTPAEKPTKPALTNNLDIHQYALAYITVPANSVTLTQSNVENAIGLSSTPFVTGILETINIDDLVAQWKSQWNDWTEEVDLNWNNWFDTVDNAWTTWFTQQQSKWEDILTERTEEWEEIKDTVDSEWASQQGSINSDYTNWKSSALAAYNQWLDQIKGTLDDDAATQLAEEVVELKNRDDVISTYQHVKSGIEHMFIGSGSNGKVKMTADIASGDKVVVSSAPKEKVTVEGATSQPGSGDPSPDNIRMIDGIGMYDKMLVLDGSSDEHWTAFIGSSNVFYIDLLPEYGLSEGNASGVKVNRLKYKQSTTIREDEFWFQSSSISSVSAFRFIIKVTGAGTNVQTVRNALGKAPLTVWYRSVDFYKCKGPFYYVHEVSDGTESPYKAIGIELNAPLFDGDSLEIGGLSGFDQMVVLDGKDRDGITYHRYNSVTNSVYIDLQGNFPHAVRTYPNIATEYGNSKYRQVGAGWAGFGAYDKAIQFYDEIYPQIGIRDVSIADLSGFRSALAASPVIFFYKSVNYTPEADIAVVLEKRATGYAVFDGTEKFAREADSVNRVCLGIASWNAAAPQGIPAEGFLSSQLKRGDTSTTEGTMQIASREFYMWLAGYGLDKSIEDIKSFLSAQYSAGTPVQVVYELASATTYAHPIQTESLPAYYGTEDFVTALAGEPVTDKWLTFTNDGTQLNFKGGGGLSSSKLVAANAEPGDVRTGKKFYAGDKTIKTGTLPVHKVSIGSYIDFWTNSLDGQKYIDINKISEGIYESNGAPFSPQVRARAELFGNAAASQVLSGVTFTSENGAKIAGTMPNQGAKTAALNAGASYMIPAGYHNGSGKVTANSLASQTQANAVAGDILTGNTAWVNGVMVTGTMPEKGTWNGTYSGSDVTIPNGHHSGTGKVSVSGGNKGAWGSTINPGGSVTIPKGYHNGSGVVKANGNSINFHPIDRTVGWGSGVRFTGEDATPGASGKMRFVLKYWCRTEYNVNGYIKVLRNGSEIHSTTFNKNYDRPYNDDVPNGYINVEFSGSGTYQIQVSVNYNAGSGEIKMGGAFIGY